MFEFTQSGVETYWWLPTLVAFGISLFTSTGGISGAFVLLPFQVSVLGFTGPAVSPTNLLYNIVAIPSGVWRYHREKRMVWPLAWVTIIGTLPGVFIGAIIRIKYLPDPVSFKFFAGLVLLYLGLRLLLDIIKKRKQSNPIKSSNGINFNVIPLEFNIKRVGYEFNGRTYYAKTAPLLALSFAVGIVGGTYGIGGGAIISPFFVAVFGLPVHTVAGAALLGTFITSIAGVLFYTVIAPFYASSGLAITPDWLLGTMFGLGGAAGIYLGARMQKFINEKYIKILLVIIILFVAGKYIIGFFM
ncbi:MAG: sulfite exporter TauE/SafE family protein [candidate division Zixibacteria bacterium]|nr:sulfite exporter TauE/SafE family protein [candidate division Zixibacteria bacterium]MDD5425485.1 sulfite exporter TauE/SafE family protein [candidate division Zixibacteria bacterium]